MGWREHLETLSRDELHEALEALLVHEIDALGCDGQIGYWENEDYPNGCLYWNATGEPVIKND